MSSLEDRRRIAGFDRKHRQERVHIKPEVARKGNPRSHAAIIRQRAINSGIAGMSFGSDDPKGIRELLFGVPIDMEFAIEPAKPKQFASARSPWGILRFDDGQGFVSY